MTMTPQKTTLRKNAVDVKHVIVMVGLPARGKTYISNKVKRYLNWIGITTEVFNVGVYRREATSDYKKHDFFQPDNLQAMEIRRQVADKCLTDAISWLDDEGHDVAIFDATNVTVERRAWASNLIGSRGYVCFFLESICEAPHIIESTIADVKVHGPDYIGMDSEEAMQDFTLRIQHYQDMYIPLGAGDEEQYSYLKIVNAGEKLVINRHNGNLQARLVYFLMNTHITPRTIYLTRHGESEMNVAGRIGGDSGLSERGRRYARALAAYVHSECGDRGGDGGGVHVWTSWLKRTIETAEGIQVRQERWKALNEIDAGVCEGLTYAEIAAEYPKEYAARQKNKLRYRYPEGESYEDLIWRLESVIMELERQENVVVVGHQAILRCIICYFEGRPQADLPYVNVPLHTLLKLTPTSSGCDIERLDFGIDAVDTHVPKAEATV